MVDVIQFDYYYYYYYYCPFSRVMCMREYIHTCMHTLGGCLLHVHDLMKGAFIIYMHTNIYIYIYTCVCVCERYSLKT